MKRMVNGMKSELKAYLQGGNSVDEYMALCDERLALERGQVSLYMQKFDKLKCEDGDISEKWELLNDELRDMGLPTRLMPIEE